MHCICCERSVEKLHYELLFWMSLLPMFYVVSSGVMNENWGFDMFLVVTPDMSNEIFGSNEIQYNRLKGTNLSAGLYVEYPCGLFE